MIQLMKKRFFAAERFAEGNLKVGDAFEVESSMGGTWAVEYVRRQDGGPVFRCEARKDWPAQSYQYDSDADAAKHLFILVPDTESEATQWKHKQHPKSIHSRTEHYC